LNLITQQLAILGQQIELLKGNTTITAANQTIVPKVANGMVLPKSSEVRTAEEIAEHNKAFELLQESKRPMK
jgi:hypothetical protein